MKQPSQSSPDRRNVFAAAARYVTAGLLALLGAAAVAKRRRVLYDGKCINRSICRNCRIYDRCGLPLALSSKNANARKQNG